MSNYTDSMTIEEQVGQLLMVGFQGHTPSQEVLDLIQRYHVGNILFFSRNIHDTGQVLELTHGLQAAAKKAGHRYPLLIAIDQENGIVQRLGDVATLFPGNMALGAIGSEQVTHDVALATGRELQALGINMNLAPVVDVNNNPANPVIGVRSFGENAQQVARLAAAMVKGYQEAGIISCLKHFPGHGDTATDSHLALPAIPYTLDRLKTLELVPFKSGIKAGSDSVMTAHIAFPALAEQETLPATLSRAIVHGLLRQQLGFSGVIISDCLEMQAIAATYGSAQAAVMALEAGIDLVLISHQYELQRDGIEAIRAAHTNGRLSPEAIEQAAERVLQLKARYLSWDALPTPGATLPPVIGCNTHLQLQRESYQRSTTLIRNEGALLPLRLDPEEQIIILSPQRNTATMVEDRYYSDETLAAAIRRYHPLVGILPVEIETEEDGYKQLLQTTSESAVFIIATVNAHLDKGQAALVRSLVSSKRRTIVIAVRNPYDLAAFPQARTVLATYEYTQPALVAAARVIFGKSEARGHLPVHIPE